MCEKVEKVRADFHKFFPLLGFSLFIANFEVLTLNGEITFFPVR